jgi:hypothetical protein
MDWGRFKSQYTYDPLTGVFNRIGGGVVGSENNQGYVVVYVGGTYYTAHRLAFLYVTGEWPSGVVDHINRTRNDNRWVNLRDVSSSENAKNTTRSRSPRSQSGRLKGFVRRRWRGQMMYMAVARIGGKPRCLGYFKTAKQANEVYAAFVQGASLTEATFMPGYSIDFDDAEIEKLKRISEIVKSGAGQNTEHTELAAWLASVCNEDDDTEETPDKPKRKKKK